MQYTIGRLRGGFAVSWVEAGKRRRFQLAERTRKEAEAEALDIIRRETIKPASATVSTLWEAYREDRKGRVIAEKMKYGSAILGAFGHLRPDQITTQTCRDYTRSRRAKGVKDGSIWTEMGHLRTVLAWAVARRLIEQAPYIERPAKPAPRDRWLTIDEIGRLLNAAETPHIHLAIVLMLTTAGRIGAILELTWDRVDFERRQIDLRMDAEGPRKGRAVVPMNGMARAALSSAHKAALSDHVIEWAGGPVRSIRTGFETAVAASKLKNVTQHTLRHTAAVHLAAAGVPMAKISQYLGHSNEAVTARVYARFAPDHLTDAAEVLDFGRFSAPKSA